jgi:hypothetical protein
MLILARVLRVVDAHRNWAERVLERMWAVSSIRFTDKVIPHATVALAHVWNAQHTKMRELRAAADTRARATYRRRRFGRRGRTRTWEFFLPRTCCAAACMRAALPFLWAKVAGKGADWVSLPASV